MDELFNMMAVTDIAGATDELLIINPDTRQIKLPSNELVFGVQGDVNGERKYFACPRIVGNNIDLATCFVRANYRNANGEIDFDLIDDLTVEGDNVLFSWEVSAKAVAYKGQVKFNISFDRPGKDSVSWHTTIATGMSLEGQIPDAQAALEASEDGIAQLVAMVDAQTAAVEAVGAEQVGWVETTGAEQIIAVEQAASDAEAASVAEIEAKGVNTLASIPDDYTALSESVDVLTRAVAPGIVCEAEGSAIVLDDASNNAVQSMRIFGRSTQDDVPTPDAPVEIKSVEKPVLTVAGKNLLSGEYATDYQTYNGIAYTDAGEGKVAVNGTATANATFAFASFAANKRTFIPAGTYTVSGNPSEDVYLAFYLYDSQEASDYIQAVSRIKGGNPWTFTIEKDSYYGTYLHVPSGNTVSTVVSPQLEIGSVATEYEAPISQQTLSITHTLPGIPVTSGGNYTDSDGQQWICDEVDLDRGVYVQRCSIVTLNFTYQAELNRYRASLPKPANTNCLNGNGIPLLCDKHTYAENAGAGTPQTNGIRIAATAPTNVIAYHNGDTIDSATILYPLATPIETPLSETELTAWRSLHTNKPNTTILNDQGAHMAVEYVADTKLYIHKLLT